MTFFVNEQGFDNVASVLDRMGQGFEYKNVQGLSSEPSEDSVLFLNCGGEVPLGQDELLEFVRAGGTLYASDLQAPLIASTFSDYVELVGDRGERGSVKANVVDPSLAEVIGKTMKLTFDMGDWQTVAPRKKALQSSRVYLTLGGQGRQPFASDTPLVMSTKVGKGVLFFTAFHNSAQDSKEEGDLLRFLLFQPIMAKSAAEQEQSLVAEKADIQRQYTAGLSADTAERTFDLPTAKGVAILTWSGQGRLSLCCAPPGELRVEAWSPPLRLDFPAGSSGKLAVRCEEFVQDEIPFNLIVATGGKAATVKTDAEPTPAPEPAVGKLRISPKPAGSSSATTPSSGANRLRLPKRP